MIGWIRAIGGFGVVALATPPLLLGQMIAVALRLDEATIPRLWHRLVVAVLGFRIHVHGALVQERPLIVAANHISWSDIMVLGSVADVHFVAKSELANWPIIGILARWQRTIFVERERKGRSAEQARAIAQRIGQGHPVALFAEGSTHDGNMIAPFKSTLFGSAAMVMADDGVARVHVQPVAIAYTRLQGLPMGRQHRPHAAWIGDRKLLPHIIALLTEGAVDVEVHFGTPFVSDGSTHRKETARRAEDEVRTLMLAALARPRPWPAPRPGHGGSGTAD